MNDPEAALQAHLAAIQHEPVVSLASVRRLHRLLDQLRNADPVTRSAAHIETALLEVQASAASRLLDRVERILVDAKPGTVEELAQRVARDDVFKLISRNMRRTRALFDALRPDVNERVPFVDVGAYTRQGRPVRGYSRYVGYVHLKGLAGLADRPVLVQEIIRCLIEGRHRRAGPSPGP